METTNKIEGFVVCQFCKNFQGEVKPNGDIIIPNGRICFWYKGKTPYTYCLSYPYRQKVLERIRNEETFTIKDEKEYIPNAWHDGGSI